MFEEINTEQRLMEFFTDNFKDAIPLFGEDNLKTNYFANPKGALISIKASPYNYKDNMVIIGDAAHAMVPFYGQGMNCGFQDVEELHRILDSYLERPVKVNGRIAGLKTALDHYSKTRVRDAHAICDLAMYNYEEMRSHVVSQRYALRKQMEGFVHLLFPRLLIPLFTMVSFSTLPYSAVTRRWRRQTYWFNALIGSVMTATGILAVLYGFRYYNHAKSLVRAVLSRAK
ncbi:hypothetical protein EC973_004695 [Apophysomyces ossiformis]|uniref:FAD-binding domain-containing protein n=1 Tax=Apophysomyces ossiformis TaxID=679940 RepID=A0A8H7BJX4_9FUNG|nr:hypothetical protein EC973_004695 [Apophysomyces ossiformis]